ncbi:MAG: PLDc N-terminal domain-containing protein [Propionibacteriaceae bacterium]|nr:PLDc N-terminal domain-containing protein [Propionibacteriaceae bacterium]
MITRILPLILLLALTIYTAVHVVDTQANSVRGIPKSLWLIIVVIIPIIGPFCWWVFGRPLESYTPPPSAPDDDLDFLRGL